MCTALHYGRFPALKNIECFNDIFFNTDLFLFKEIIHPIHSSELQLTLKVKVKKKIT